MAANDNNNNNKNKNKSGLGKVHQPPQNVFDSKEVMELYSALLLLVVELYKDESNESVEKKIIKTTQKLFEYLCKLKDTTSVFPLSHFTIRYLLICQLTYSTTFKGASAIDISVTIILQHNYTFISSESNRWRVIQLQQRHR